MPENNIPIIPIDLSTGPAPTGPDITGISIPAPSKVDFQGEQSFTGAPVEEKPQSYLDLDLGDVMARYKNSGTLYDNPVVTPEPLTRKYGENFNAFIDNEEVFGRNQSAVSQALNGIAKMGVKTIGAFAEGLLSIPYTVSAIKSGDFNELYQGEWAEAIDNMMNNSENVFPNYYTKKQQESPFFSAIPFSGGGANFWFDKFAKNLGYTIGAIGSAVVQDLAIGAATEGIGELPLVANQVGKASLWLNKLFTGTNRLEDALTTASMLGKSDDALLTMTQLARASEAARIGKSAEYLSTLYFASNAEAGMEAREGYSAVKKDLEEQFFRENGYYPSAEDKAKIDDYAQAAGNVRYGLNMAVLMLSNAVQFEHILKPWNSYKQGLKKGIEATVPEQIGAIGVKGEIKTAEDIGKLAVIEPTTKAGKAWKFVKPAIPNIFSEGIFEEGGQFAIGEGTKKYFEDKYNGKNKSELDAIINDTVYGLGQQFGTTEGLENMFLGGLTGMFMSPITTKIENMQKANAGVLTSENATLSALKNLNTQGVTGLFENNYSNAAESLKISQDLSKAVDDKNIFRFKNLKADSFYNFIISGIQNARHDVRIEQLKMLKELPDAELNKLFNMEKGSRASNHAYIDELIDKAQNIKKSHDAIANIFANPYKYTGSTKSEEAIKQDAAWKAFEDYKAALVKMSYNVNDFNARLSSMQEQMSNISPLLNNETVSKLTNPGALRALKVEYKEQANELQKQLDDNLISRSKDPVLYKSMKDQIASLETYAENIGTFLSKEDPDELLGLFPKLLNFEISGRNLENKNTIDPVHSVDLINIGNDINQIEMGKKFAASTYEHLFTQEGYNDFMKNHEEWSKGLSFTEAVEPEVSDTHIKIGDTSYETDRNYKTTIKDRFTVPTGTTQLKNPFGEVVDTFKTKEEAEQARDDENKNIEENLNAVKLIRSEGTKVIVEDAKGIIQKIDPRYLSDAEKTLSEEEIVEENEEFYDNLDEELNKDSQDIPDTDSGEDTPEYVENAGEREDPKKAPEIVNQSTTSNPKDTGAYLLRQRAFFANFDRLPDSVTQNARIIYVHENNQKALGIDGIIDPLYVDKDPTKTILLAVFVKQEGDGFKFLTPTGETTTDINSMVWATMPVSNLDENRWRNTTPMSFKVADNKNWDETRKKIISSDSVQMYNFNISRGFPERDFRGGTGLRYNPVTEVLVTKADIDNGKVITISDGQVEHLGQLLDIQAGKLVLQNGNTLEQLENRTFTEVEAQRIYDVLHKFVSTSTEYAVAKPVLNKEILAYLKGIFYWRQPKSGVKTNARQIYLLRGYFYIGNLHIPFTIKSFEDNKKALIDAIKGVYINANNKLLNENLPFRELSVENGQLKAKTWETYQHFLISDTNDLKDNHPDNGTKRDVAVIPFRTSIRPIDPNVPNDANFVGKYAIITGNINDGAPMYKTTVSAPKTPAKEKEKEKKVKEKTGDVRNGITFGGETVNSFPVEGGNIRFGVKETKDGNAVSFAVDDTYKNYIKSLVKTPTQGFLDTLEAWEEKTATKDLAEEYLIAEINNYIDEVMAGYVPAVLAEPVTSISTEEKMKKKLEELKEKGRKELEAEEKEAKTLNVLKPDGSKPKINVDDLDLGDDEAFRRARLAGNYEEHDLAKDLLWAKGVIPNTIEILPHLIQVTGGGYAWGKYQNRVISVYQNALKGTVQHEAFEAVWGDFLPLEERKRVYNEFKSRSGSFISHETGEKINYKDATEHQAKEELAEEFGEYVFTGKPKVTGNAIIRFFKRLIGHIKELIFGKDTIQKLFEKINNGYYKNAAYITSEGSTVPQYRIAGLTETDTYNIVRGMTYFTIGEMFANNRSLIEFDSHTQGDISELYTKVREKLEDIYTVKVPAEYKKGNLTEFQYLQYQKVWESIKNDSSTVNRLLKEFLRTVNIVADFSNETLDNVLEEKELIEKESETTEYASRNADSYVSDQFSVDAKRSASNSVKLLMITLPETTFKDPEQPSLGTKPKRDVATLMPQMVNYNKTFNFLLNQLAPLNTWQEKANKMIELAKVYPNYIALNKRLKIGQAHVDPDTWTLRAKFFNVMSKQKPKAYTQFIDKKKSTASASSTTVAFTDKAQEWLDSLKLQADSKKEDALIKVNKEGQYVFDGSPLTKKSVRTVEDQLNFLSALNIPFTEELYKRLSVSDQKKFTEAVKGLYKYLSNKKNIIDITSGSLDNARNFNKLVELYFLATEDISSTRFNITGNKQQQFVGNNFISNTINDINNAKSIEDFHNRLPYMDQPYRADSRYIKDFLFTRGGVRTEKRLEIGVNDGVVDEKYQDPISIAKMTAPVRMMAEINMNLIGNYYIFVPADSKTEWMLKMSHLLPFSSFEQGDIRTQIYNIFNGYYKTERELATKNADGSIKKTPEGISEYRSTMWNREFNPDYSGEELDRKAFNEYLDKNVVSLVNYLVDNNIIDWFPAKGNKSEYYTIKSLNSDFISESDLGVNELTNEKTKAVKRKFTRAELIKLFMFTEVNYMINNIEMLKLLFGDPATTKDPLKRYKSYISPRETAIYDNPQFDKSRNESTNKAGNLQLERTDPYYWEYKNYIPTITLADLRSAEARIDLGKYTSIVNDKHIADKSISGSYENTNPVDGQSYGLITFYREMLDKNGGRWSSEHEELLQYILATDRQMMYLDGILHDREGEWGYYRPELQKADNEIADRGYDGSVTLHIVKPIGSGITVEGNLFLDKTSLAPLTYGFVRNSPAMTNLYLKMLKSGIGYAIYDSGRKLGAGKEQYELYNKDGSVNQRTFENIINVPHRYYGVQVETMGAHGEGPLGSQLTKLAVANLRDAGVTSPHIAEKIKRHNRALDNITNYGYKSLLNKLGIVDEGSRFAVPDKSKIVRLLKSELFKREAPQNLKDALELDENGEFKVPFEALANYQQIKDILFSFVDKMITKPKMNGGPKIQMAGSGFEVDGRTVKKATVDGVEVLVSNGLKFYSAEYNDQGKRTSVSRMEVLLPMYFYNKIKNHPTWADKSDAEILDYLNSSEEGKSILNGVGFRIPTQESNSVEAFTIVGFLPFYMGDTIVLPESITTKSGGDFDVDKLNTYLRNVYIDKNGDINTVKYFADEATHNQFYTNVFNDILKQRIKSTKGSIRHKTLKTDLIEDYLQNVTSEKIDRYTNLFNQILEDAESYDELTDFQAEIEEKLEELVKKLGKLTDKELQDILLQKFLQNTRREALQNEYYASLEELILLPENYERLIRPNSAKKGKDLRTKLVKLAPSEFDVSNDKSLINRQYMSMMRHLFLVGKAWVGISASSQTNNAVNQSSKIILNRDRIKELESYQKNYLSLNDGILLLRHNQLELDGKVSATLSKMRSQSGEYISDIISRYIDGPVDIAKDSWVTQLFQNTKIFSTALAMIKLGIPDETVVMFLNQPIIREYIKNLENKNVRWLYNEKNMKQTFVHFGITPIEFKGKSIINPLKIKEIDENTLSNNIEKYYNGKKLTAEENERQKTIFYEFLKYAIIGDQLFEFQRSTSYDTSASPDPIMQLRKTDLLDKVRAENIFTSVDEVFDNTQLGIVRDRVQDASKAIEQSYSLFNNDTIKQNLVKVLRQLPKFSIDYEKVSRNVEASYLTYLIQTNLGINNEIERLMIDQEKSVAARLWKVKSFLWKHARNSDIANNQALKELVSVVKNKYTDIKNINLAHKATEVFTSDVYTNAFRELRDSGTVVADISIPDLYRDILTLSLLQSGLMTSKLSYSKYIPYEDYTAAITPLLRNIAGAPNLNEFATNGSFFRNNWKNKEIVPSLNEDYNTDFGQPASKYKVTGNIHKEFGDLKQKYGIVDNNYRLFQLWHTKNRAQNTYITMNVWNNFQDQINEVAPTQLLLQRLEDESGNPIFIPNKIVNGEALGGHYLFVPINPLGDGIYLQEHYTNPRPSLAANAHRFKTEIPMNEILNELGFNLDMSEISRTFVEPDLSKSQFYETETIKSELKYTPENIISLTPNQIFVFGSNAEGAHGKGAALIAKQKFGAIQGQSEGLQGQSYAVITKKNWRVEKSSTLEEIKIGLQDMLLFAGIHPEKEFLVTKLGSSLAGYTISQIRGLFEELQEIIPNNVILPIEYEVRNTKQEEDVQITPLEELEKELSELEEAKQLLLEHHTDIIIAQAIPKISPASASKETGGKAGFGKDINSSMLSKTGKTVQGAAHSIMEDSFNEEQGIDEQYIRNVIIEVLTTGKKKFIDKIVNQDRIDYLKNSIKDMKKITQGDLFDVIVPKDKPSLNIEDENNCPF